MFRPQPCIEAFMFISNRTKLYFAWSCGNFFRSRSYLASFLFRFRCWIANPTNKITNTVSDEKPIITAITDFSIIFNNNFGKWAKFCTKLENYLIFWTKLQNYLIFCTKLQKLFNILHKTDKITHIQTFWSF